MTTVAVVSALPAVRAGLRALIESDAGLRAVVFLGARAGTRRLPAGLAGRPFAYLPRDAGRETIIAAVRAVGQGLLVLDPVAAGDLLAPAALEEAPSEGA